MGLAPNRCLCACGGLVINGQNDFASWQRIWRPWHGFDANDSGNSPGAKRNREFEWLKKSENMAFKHPFSWH